MRGWIFISLLGSIGAVFQCDLTKGKPGDFPFPNIQNEYVEFYQMAVEHRVPGEINKVEIKEYYDKLQGRGRLDKNTGDTFSYIYRTASWEAWVITTETCDLKNITDTPKFYRDLVDEWIYEPPNEPNKRTIGPSAMFKIGYEAWNSKKEPMFYMGIYEDKIEGFDVRYWRRCISEISYVDYFFKVYYNKAPLRVVFGGRQEGLPERLWEKKYDITSFHPSISQDLLELPIGIGCARGIVEDAPEIPDFTNTDLQFRAEVEYYTVESSSWNSYYSNLSLALDLSSQHLAYRNTRWSKTQRELDANINVIYDLKHGYLYKDTDKCEINRQKSFVTEIELPDIIAGSITFNSVLFPLFPSPNTESHYLKQGIIRSHRVNIFEVVVEDYLIKRKASPKAIITYAYLQDDEVDRVTDSVNNSLVQVQMRFTGRKKVETLTFDIFEFTTELRNRSSTFNIQKCIGNDDYVWATIDFKADKGETQDVINDVPNIQSKIQNAITQKLEVNSVRIPVIKVDLKDGIFVTLMILEKPPVILDYMDLVRDHTILVTTQSDVENFDSCATRCLITEKHCWGFSMCGTVCHFGTEYSKEVGPKRGCNLYERFDTQDFVLPLERVLKNIRRQVRQNEISLMLKGKNDSMVQIDAFYLEITHPGEEDRILSRIGTGGI